MKIKSKKTSKPINKIIIKNKTNKKSISKIRYNEEKINKYINKKIEPLYNFIKKKFKDVEEDKLIWFRITELVKCRWALSGYFHSRSKFIFKKPRIKDFYKFIDGFFRSSHVFLKEVMKYRQGRKTSQKSINEINLMNKYIETGNTTWDSSILTSKDLYQTTKFAKNIYNKYKFKEKN